MGVCWVGRVRGGGVSLRRFPSFAAIMAADKAGMWSLWQPSYLCSTFDGGLEIFNYMLRHSPVSPLSECHKIHSAAWANLIFATDRGNEPQQHISRATAAPNWWGLILTAGFQAWDKYKTALSEANVGETARRCLAGFYVINSLVWEVLQLPGVKIRAEIHIWPHRPHNAYFRVCINYILAPLALGSVCFFHGRSTHCCLQENC